MGHSKLVQPQALHTTLGRGCMVRAQPGWGWWGVGAAPAGRDESTGRDQTLRGYWQGPGGRPRRLCSFPRDSGISVVRTWPTAASPGAHRMQERGCFRNRDALTRIYPSPHRPHSSNALCRGILAPCKQGRARKRSESQGGQHRTCQTLLHLTPWPWDRLVRYF